MPGAGEQLPPWKSSPVARGFVRAPVTRRWCLASRLACPRSYPVRHGVDECTDHSPRGSSARWSRPSLPRSALWWRSPFVPDHQCPTFARVVPRPSPRPTRVRLPTVVGWPHFGDGVRPSRRCGVVLGHARFRRRRAPQGRDRFARGHRGGDGLVVDRRLHLRLAVRPRVGAAAEASSRRSPGRAVGLRWPPETTSASLSVHFGSAPRGP